MKQQVLIIIAIIACSQFCIAQTASDVLEKGIHVQSGKKLFLRFDNSVLKFDVAKSLHDPAKAIDYITLEDSAIFLITKNGVNVYLAPINPLNYSYTTETKEIVDPVNEAASKALASIIDVLSTTGKKVSTPGPLGASSLVTVYDTCTTFGSIESALKTVQERLKKDQKDEIVKIFKSLKELSFAEESATKAEIKKIEKAKDPIKKYFDNINSLLETAQIKIDQYNCDKPGGLITKYVFSSICRDLKTLAAEQQKRLANLEIAYKLVKKVQVSASAGDGSASLKWCIKLDEVASKEGKISSYTVTIKESGYKLSDKNEIVDVEPKNVIVKNMRFRKYQLFVPEISIGTALTFFKYNTYGTTSDSAGIHTGNQHVASPVENTVRNINISTMINWNLYCPNSPIHPLIQTGVGINAGIPTLLFGGGVRFGNNSKNRLRITMGIAFSWIKDLDKLKVGDVVTGTDDIDKDMQYRLTWWGEKNAPKPYLSIQYNF